jgi:hypothetical protein
MAFCSPSRIALMDIRSLLFGLVTSLRLPVVMHCKPFRTHRTLLRILLALTVPIGAFTGIAVAAPIAIPNGDFSDAGNFGTVGGGPLGGSGTDVVIGAGPWTGSFAGILSLLAPPTLTISAGQAQISGLAAANIISILNNGGYFSQTLTTDYVAQERYTLSVHVDTGTTLDLGVLASGNFGIALRSGTDTLASTATAPPQLISLVPVSGTTYMLTLLFDSNDTTAGAIDVQLFAEPQGLIGASLLTSVTFSAVALDATAINPVSGSIVASGGSVQTTTVVTAFADPLQVRVTDMVGDPVPGVTVTFSAPASGASATLSAPTAVTDINGFAEVDATANTIAGSYVVTASVENVDTPASFSLTNSAGAAASSVTATGGTQSTPVNTSFPLPLVVFVADEYGNAVAGADATFAAPASGPSAVLSDTNATTDASGLAQVSATANGEVGSYIVSATVDGVAVPASFELSNRVDKGTTIGPGSGGGSDGQSAGLDSAFLCALSVSVADGEGTPQAGFAVDFTAPDTGASAILFDGVTSGSTLRVLTDSSGTAIVSATANDIAGDFLVIAQLVASSAPAVEFSLHNIDGLMFRNGFDTPCVAPFAPLP